MSERYSSVVEDELEGEWLEPSFNLPPVPSYCDNMKLVEVEKKVRGALAYIDAIPRLAKVGQQAVQARGGRNILYIYISPQRALIELRTPLWKLLEGRIEIKMPDVIRNA